MYGITEGYDLSAIEGVAFFDTDNTCCFRISIFFPTKHLYCIKFTLMTVEKYKKAIGFNLLILFHDDHSTIQKNDLHPEL